MAFAFGGAGALLKAFIPTLPALNARRSIQAAGQRFSRRNRGAPAASPPVQIPALSPEAEAALAPLGLPPDGPIDPNAAQRARLTPDVAARNFVRWAQALELDGDYATRSVYALYCEFSEVDGRPPLRDTRFLPALAHTEGVATVARGKDKTCRLWRWTIQPAKPVEVVAEAIADVWSHVADPAPDRATKAAAQAPDPVPAQKGPAPAVAPPLAQSPAHTPDVPALTRNAETAPPAPPPARATAAKAPVPAPARAPKGSAPAVSQAPAAATRQTAPQPAATQAPAAAAQSAGAIAAASATPAKPARSPIVLPRFVADTDHPFSPAGLRERQKSARRLRLDAAASRKQRGGVRRAA